MKKIIYNKYGGVDEMEMIETAIQETTDSTVLVQIRAVSVNPIDWKIREGQMKLMSGSKFPKGVGIDFSGVVEKTGAAITRFKKGDAVFGSIDQFKGGALAEYLLVAEKEIVLKPDSISFEKAAAIPVVGFAALQLFDKLISVQQGTEILINGASGGVGIFATQIAKNERRYRNSRCQRKRSGISPEDGKRHRHRLSEDKYPDRREKRRRERVHPKTLRCCH